MAICLMISQDLMIWMIQQKNKQKLQTYINSQVIMQMIMVRIHTKMIKIYNKTMMKIQSKNLFKRKAIQKTMVRMVNITNNSLYFLLILILEAMSKSVSQCMKAIRLYSQLTISVLSTTLTRRLKRNYRSFQSNKWLVYYQKSMKKSTILKRKKMMIMMDSRNTTWATNTTKKTMTITSNTTTATPSTDEWSCKNDCLQILIR